MRSCEDCNEIKITWNNPGLANQHTPAKAGTGVPVGNVICGTLRPWDTRVSSQACLPRRVNTVTPHVKKDREALKEAMKQ